MSYYSQRNFLSWYTSNLAFNNHSTSYPIIILLSDVIQIVVAGLNTNLKGKVLYDDGGHVVPNEATNQWKPFFAELNLRCQNIVVSFKHYQNNFPLILKQEYQIVVSTTTTTERNYQK